MGAALCSNGTKVVSKAKIHIATSKLKRTKHDKLWTAIENNEYKTAELYLDFNEINETDLFDQQGQTMLHLSASLGHADLLMLLIERTGAKPDIVDQQLCTPLHLACRFNRLSAVQFLLGCGVDVNIQDEFGQTPLLVCCVHGNLEIVRMLVEASIAGHLAEPIEVHVANNQGLTPLNCAAIKGDLEMTKCLVSRGGATVDQTSPKGCTPLIYAGRGGYCDVVQYLLQKQASPLKQDSSGGTVFHHAVEKSHIEVLETMLQAGVDVYSAVEIADNAGRTPLFEAVEQDLVKSVIKLTLAKEQYGFQCNVNVVNYNGQTPLFIAAKQGNLDLVNILLEAGADPNLNQGELSKQDDDFDEAESAQEKNLLEAFKNCQTPLQVAAVLGYDNIAITLAEKSNINHQTTTKGYTVLHLCVLANRPELIIEFVTKWQANPMIEDKIARALLDMIYQYLPSYVSCFQAILEQQYVQPVKQIREVDRQITGVQQGSNQNSAVYDQSAATVQQELEMVQFDRVDLSQIEGSQDSQVERFYGKQIALCLALQQNWQLKEQALRQAVIQTERFLSKSEITEQTIKMSLVDCVEGALMAVRLTCREKIIKVFNQALQLFNLVTQSSRIDKDPKARSAMEQMLPSIVTSFLQQSEQTNQRVCGKIHASLIDLSFSITPKMVTEILYTQLQKQQQSTKATQAHLQLLLKMCQQFIIHKSKQQEQKVDALTWYLIVEQILPFLSNSNSEVRSLSIKVLLQVQQKTGFISEEDLDSLDSKVKLQVWNELAGVKLTEQLTDQKIATCQKVIGEKAHSKDWTQREIALTNMQEYVSKIVVGADIDDVFMQQCLSLLQQSLDDRNIQIYLMAVNITAELIKKFSTKEIMIDQLPTLLQSILLRTADTNTRVRKQSCELCLQLWDLPLHKKSNRSTNQIIAQLVVESSERAIVGRIGVMVKRALLVDDLSKRPVNLVLGLDYEQLTHFSCQWIMHKTTKVRQSASRLICEICRLNVIDKRGLPFKPQILRCILGLRQSIREPLIKKINQLYPGYIPEPENDCQKAVANEGALPSVQNSLLAIIPQVVLPHSEPLSQIQIDSLAQLIELFGLQLVTCFYSQSWSTRLAVLDKLQEQIHQLDPNLRDAMVAEINRNNLPPEITLKTFLQLCEEGLKDPVLKNYLKILELLQQALPLYAKYLRQEQIKRELSPLVKQIVNKTADMKQKVREASINFLLYLSHQLDYETVCLHVLNELDFSNKQIGNSAMITSCLNLACLLQSQSKFIKASDQQAYKEVTRVVNQGLKHQNPQVRKQAEQLFKTMYESFPSYAAQLQGQKQSLVASLIAYCSQQSGGDLPQQEQVLGKESLLVSDYFDQTLLARLQSPNHKQRLQAIIELRKAIQQKLSQINTKTQCCVNQSRAFESILKQLDPCTLLIRHLLKDDNTEVYIEVLNLLKFTAGSFAAHLSQLDLHLMMGSFISLIISSDHQIKARVASDKVVIYFCKHSGIGPTVVAKEILKLVERLNKQPDLRLVRYYGLVQLLISQFSVVLCYQPDFMKKALELLADSMSLTQEEPQIKSAAQQLVTLLYQTDKKNMQSQVNLLDFTKKTHIRKVIIELENQSNKGLVQAKRLTSPAKSFTETQISFTTSTRLASPAMSRRLQQNQKSDKDNLGQTEAQWPTQPSIESLPIIERKRVPGQGFISSKAAGFNRNLLNQTQGIADISNLRLFNAPAKQKNEDKLTDMPLYVPTQRTQMKRKDENTLTALAQPSIYTPTLLQRRL